MLAMSNQVETKRLGRPKGRVFTVVIPTRYTPEQVALVDAWAAEQPDPKPTRAEAIRRLVEEALRAKRS